MRIVAIVHCYPPEHNAGAEWMIHSLFRGLIAAGHDVTVILTAQSGPEYELHGVTVHPMQGKHEPAVYAQSADLLITHLENTPRTTALARIFHKPMVHVLHNTFEPSKRWLERDVDLAVFNSYWMANDYKAYQLQHERPEVPSIIVNPPVFADEYRVECTGDSVTLINMTDAKGAPLFWALAQRMPDVKFLGVIGGYGEQIGHPEHLPNVEIHSHTSDIREVYGKTRILLMPSEYESWGRVGVEAMASGIPVIANPTPGLRESLGAAGYFVSRRDLEGWETQIRFLLDGRRYKTASRKALARSAELDPAPGLEKFVTAVEVAHARHGFRH